MSGRIRIGISGWRYAGWRGVFYPEGLPQRQELEYASQRLSSIEINGSFYSLQTPADFVFAVKGGRYITHMLRLREVRTALSNFFASGVLGLREKLGPLLWQLPPNLQFEPERLEAFLRLLPRDTLAALDLARAHSEWMAGRTGLQLDRRRPLRHAIEVRHDSFLDTGFVALLRRHQVALVVADTAGNWPYREDVTGDFVYVRLHGEDELYASGYTEAALERWARRIDAWARGREPEDARRIAAQPAPPAASRDVYCYFDNDAKVHAPFDAQCLMQKLGLSVPDPEAAVAVKSSSGRAKKAPVGTEGAPHTTQPHPPPRTRRITKESRRG